MGMHGSGWWSFISSDPETRPKMTRELLRRVMAYARPYRWQIVAMLVTILTNTGLTLLSPLILRQLIDETLPQRNLDQLWMLAFALLILPVAGGLINVVQRRLNSYVGEGVIYDLRVGLFAHLQRMSLRFFTNTKVGELMSRLNNDVVGAQNAISNTIVAMVTNLVQAAAVMLVMLRLEWRLTLLSILILPLFVLTARLLGTRLRDIARQHMEINAMMNAMMNETLNIGGALLVKLFGRTTLEVQRFDGRARQVRDIGVRRATLGVTFFVIIGLLSAVGSALVYGIGGYLVIQGVFTVGTIVAFGAYLSSLYSALQGLSNAPVEFATSMVSFERVFELLDLPVDIAEAPDAVELPDVRGELVFENVSFQYQPYGTRLLSDVKRFGRMDNIRAVLSGDTPAGQPGKDGDQKAPPAGSDKPDLQKAAPAMAEALPASLVRDEDETGDEDGAGKSQARQTALVNISFHAQPGQLIALVGPSGAGKTTLTYLIPRLYDPQEGRILIDGLDLRQVTLSSLTTQIGMVTQETHLFHDTIRTNLVYARLDATQEEVEAAARAANIHNFIAALPEGYDTVVGERGYRLSGGEKQRLALARVILKNPRILVLDEATSHLDSESEALIQEALKRVMAGRTSIVIAHRLSTILAADQILVMDRGQIVERGTHADLQAQGGLYAHLYETQFSHEAVPER